MKGSDFVFDYADGLYCKCSKISLSLGGPLTIVCPPFSCKDFSALLQPLQILRSE